MDSHVAADEAATARDQDLLVILVTHWPLLVS
jgi:hypothetical protein